MQDITSAKERIEIPLRLQSQDGADSHTALGRLVGTFTYSSCHVLPTGVRNLLQDSEGGDDTNDGCDCGIAQCGTADADCDCIDDHGCFYDDEGRIDLDAIPPRFALYECGPACSCRGECHTRVVQAGMSQKCEVRWITGKGFGLFALSDIRKGSLLCTYSGQILSTAEARQRWARQADTGEGNYILVLKETISSNDGRLQTLKTIVDPTYVGNVGRFMNHACPPAATHIVLPVRAVGTLVPMPALFAVRDLDCGEELTWDYGDAGGEGWYYGRPSDVAVGDITCKCSSPRCRGAIPYDATL